MIESFSNLRQPWRLVTFALGLGLLYAGALHPATAAPDWDLSVSTLQASACLLLAGPAARNVQRGWRERRAGPLLLALLAGWICADLLYTGYWYAVDRAVLMDSWGSAIAANWCLFGLTAMLWRYESNPLAGRLSRRT